MGPDVPAMRTIAEIKGGNPAVAVKRRSSDGRAVPLSCLFSSSDDDVALLAFGFGRGERSALAVPNARRPNA